MKNIRLGDVLIEFGYITPDQLNTALAYQKEHRDLRVGQALQELGYVNERQVLEALAQRLQLKMIDIEHTNVDVTAVEKVPQELAQKYDMLPIAQSPRALTIAANDPLNYYALEDIRQLTGLEPEIVLAELEPLRRAIRYYYAEVSARKAARTANDSDMAAAQTEDLAIDMTAEGGDLDAPIIRLLNSLVQRAVTTTASDIHIEPFKTRTRIRFRIDGELVEQEAMKVSIALHNSLITRIKILGGMNIAEKRIPLDGRFGMKIDGINLDVRVSTIPCVYGEKCVIRLLSTADEKTRKITDLGMTDYNYEMFKQIIRCPNGVMLVTGPTGSGKSTTLYATLGELSKPNVNIVTVEDPVEKKIDGVNQCQINAKAGMTFAAALRSILRQDPDIIMVGEIRDGETADIAIRAAITGHFVLSTLHTNDAASTIVRLVDMGVAPYMVASSLVGIIAQRLVKLLCNECKETITLSDPADLRLVSRDKPVQICQAHKGGCKKCRGTGYSGRTAIHEIIVTSNDIKELISKGATAEEIGAKATENGTLLLRDNVTQMVLAGRTTMDELVKATYTV